MTLRSRLVAGLVILVLAGLAIFGFSTYSLYSRTQYERLDDQLRNAVPSATCVLFSVFASGGPDCGRGATAPYGTYAAMYDRDGHLLYDASGEVIEVIFVPLEDRRKAATPYLASVKDPGEDSTLFTTRSTSGGGDWRVSISRLPARFGDTEPILIAVAIPTKEVTESLRRLVLIEGTAAACLLVILAGGSWLILRRGLRPLEQMASATRDITAGDLSRRVEPSDGRTEVGQLGLAMNTMLSEIEQAFDEREATEQRLRQFLADASHELRTPLTSIQGFAELFRLGADHPDLDLPTVMRRIEQESARMRLLVDDLLLLARLDQPRPIRPVTVDLAVLCADACSDARALAPDRPVTLDAPEPVVVRGDRDHLRQAIANLVTNAVRHTPDGAAIEVSARFITAPAGSAEAVVTVRDHGGGLDADALQHAFDRFWRADSARVGAGSGLGLSIVEGIVREHHGSASAANALDGGAVFTIRLPTGVGEDVVASQQTPRDAKAPPQS
jgi:two-component system OmpR family sensor kinase